MDHDGRMLADALENPALGAQIDILQVVAKLRYLADRLDATLKIANDLAESMDAVHADRLALATKVNMLTVERDAYVGQLRETSPA